ncbi:MAG: transcriptional regulator, MerR family [Firmicutes bacterium]|nr:transcriptional regulator, MerR family [Bacillota bacterium]
MNQKWTIGEMAKLFDISTDTLRYYERAGLLSSDRHCDNGYRYYSYDDLVTLMDILLFRSLEVTVKDIRPMINTMGLGDIKQVLLENDRLVTERIEALVRQKRLLGQSIAQYELCEQQLGKFSLVPAPSFQYNFWGAQQDLIEIIRLYKKPDRSWLHNIRYTLLLPPDDLFTTQSFATAQIGISFDDEILRSLDLSERQEFTALPAKECLYTVLGTDYSSQGNEILIKALAWLEAQGRQVEGPLIGRYLASNHKDGRDYYEIWIVLDSA